MLDETSEGLYDIYFTLDSSDQQQATSFVCLS